MLSRYRQVTDQQLEAEIARLERELDRLDECDYHPRAAAEREAYLGELVRVRTEQERRRT